MKEFVTLEDLQLAFERGVFFCEIDPHRNITIVEATTKRRFVVARAETREERSWRFNEQFEDKMLRGFQELKDLGVELPEEWKILQDNYEKRFLRTKSYAQEFRHTGLTATRRRGFGSHAVPIMDSEGFFKEQFKLKEQAMKDLEKEIEQRKKQIEEEREHGTL